MAKKYYENGNLKEEKFITGYTLMKLKNKNDFFTAKVFNGSYREYYSNGLLKEEGNFTNGKKAKLFNICDSIGNIKEFNYFIVK